MQKQILLVCVSTPQPAFLEVLEGLLLKKLSSFSAKPTQLYSGFPLDG